MTVQKIGRYRITNRLGKGAMGLVVQAHDPKTNRDVAIKVLHRRFAVDPIIRERFKREALTIARLDHPCIVPIYDVGQDGDLIYLVMRLMIGGSLAEKIQQTGELPPEDIISVVQRVGSALDFIHQAGIIHRDVKPENILFDQFGQPFLADFGIVKLDQAGGTLTVDRMIGTPAYMSPELVEGTGNIDGRSDLYALGVVLFHMLCGTIPFEGDTAMRMAMQHVIAPIPDITTFNKQLNKRWQAVVNQAMAKAPDDRFQTGTAITEAIRAVFSHQRKNRTGATLGFTQLPWLPILGLATAILLVLFGAIGFLNSQGSSNSNAELTATSARPANATVIAMQSEAEVLVSNVQQTQEAQQAALEQEKVELSARVEAQAAEATELANRLEEEFAAREAEIIAENAEAQANAAGNSNCFRTIGYQQLAALGIPSLDPTEVSSETPVVNATWAIVNGAECPLRKIRFRSIQGGIERVPDILNNDGNPTEVIEVGATATLSLSFEDVTALENMDETWYLVVADAEDFDLELLGKQIRFVPGDALTFVDLNDVASNAVEQSTPTPQANNVAVNTDTNSSGNSSADSVQNTIDPTPNWNVTRTVVAAQTRVVQDQQNQQAAKNAQATQTRQAAQASFSATQTRQVQEAQSQQQQAAKNAQATQTRQAAQASFSATQTRQVQQAQAQQQQAARDAQATQTRQAAQASFSATQTRQVQQAQAQQQQAARDAQATQTRQAAQASFSATQTRQAQQAAQPPSTQPPVQQPTAVPANPYGCDYSNPTDDADNDGKQNQYEVPEGLNPCNSDTDNDGFKDGFDLCPTDPAPGSGNGCKGSGGGIGDDDKGGEGG